MKRFVWFWLSAVIMIGILTGCAAASSQPDAGSASAASSQFDSAQPTPEPTWSPEPDDTGELSPVEHALNGTIGWEEVPAEELDGWLDSLGYDRTEDANYPGLTTDILQGSWLWVEDGVILTFEGNLCTVSYPEYNQQYTVPYLLINRSAEHKCPRLTILDSYDNTTGLTFYIRGMTREDRISTTNFGDLLRR